jgi:hypothetical protein
LKKRKKKKKKQGMSGGTALGPTARARRVFFTLNNPETLLDWPKLQAEGATLLVYQKEKGDKEETPHFQGVICFSKQMRLSALKNLPGLERAHFESVKSLHHAIAYCKKDDTRVEGPWEHGDAPKQGARSDLAAVKADLDAGKSLREISQLHFDHFIRYNKAFTTYKRIVTTPRDFKTICFVLVGPSGIGKSRTASVLARALSGASVYYATQPKGSGWYFDDYGGEETMVIDEMDGSTCPPTFFNSLIDRYPFSLPAHGSAGHQMVSKYCIITTNYLPKDWWKKRSPSQVEQTTRRIEVFWPMLRPTGPREYVTLPGSAGNVPDVLPYTPYSVPNKRAKHADEATSLIPNEEDFWDEFLGEAPPTFPHVITEDMWFE